MLLGCTCTPLARHLHVTDLLLTGVILKNTRTCCAKRRVETCYLYLLPPTCWRLCACLLLVLTLHPIGWRLVCACQHSKQHDTHIDTHIEIIGAAHIEAAQAEAADGRMQLLQVQKGRAVLR